MSKKTVRAIAVHVCYAVIYKRIHLSEAFSENLTKKNTSESHSAVKALCFDAIRHYVFLADLWKQCVTKTPKDKMVRVIMSLALCEYIHQNKAAHVVVNEAINTAKYLNKQWARGLINATLRKAISHIDAKELNCTDDSAKYAHPPWWITTLKKDWPQHWQKILQSNNLKPPLWIRAKRNVNVTEAIDRHKNIESALKIPPQDITKNDQFKQGLISVQDASAQLAAYIMQPQNGMRILDACSAPGGKTCHLLEYNPNIELDAIELYPNRAKKINDNLNRLNLTAHVITGDATKHQDWFKGPAYQQILLDAPCSASGIIRRHPDIKFLRTSDDLIEICQDQQKLLSSLAELLDTNGTLLYATCSVFQQENSDQIKLFLKSHPEFSEITLKYSFAINCEHGIQILPGNEDMDGFYYCYLRKNDI